MNVEESTMTVNRIGTKTWKNKNGELHRVDGPAIEWANGDKEWYQNGERHRVDGPTIKYANGDKEWYQNGKLHRVGGPARESIHGYKKWYLNGKKLSRKKYLKAVEENETTETSSSTENDYIFKNRTLLLAIFTFFISQYLIHKGNMLMLTLVSITALLYMTYDFIQSLRIKRNKENKKLENTKTQTLSHPIKDSSSDSPAEKKINFSEQFSQNLKVLQAHDPVEAELYEKRMIEILALLEKGQAKKFDRLVKEATEVIDLLEQKTKLAAVEYLKAEEESDIWKVQGIRSAVETVSNSLSIEKQYL